MGLLEKLRDVEMEVIVRFGFVEMPLRDVAALATGSMIELNRSVDEPVELLVNNRPFARGEVVVVDGYYSIRITEVTPAERHSNIFSVESLAGSIDNTEQSPAQDQPEAKPRPENPPAANPQTANPPAGAKPPNAPPPNRNPQGQPQGQRPAAPPPQNNPAT